MNQSASTMTGKTKMKIVFLGNQSVGKSSIIQRYIKNIFEETANPTVGIDFLVKNVVHRNKHYRLQLWDTAGQERFRALIPNYLKDAKCALIILDVENKSSLNSIQMWIDLFNENKKGDQFNFIVLVGNKIDLQHRQITQGQALKKAAQLKLPYFEVSAKTGKNIDGLFQRVIDVYEARSVQSINFTIKNTDIIQEQQFPKEQQSQIKHNNQVGEVLAEQETRQEKNVVLKNEKIQKEPKNKEKCC